MRTGSPVKSLWHSQGVNRSSESAMAGPIVVGQRLLMNGQRATVVGWVGAAIALLGFFFFVRTAPESVRIAASAIVS